MVTKFIHMLEPGLVQTFMYDLDGKMHYALMLRQNKLFKTYKYARYATDVIFQQANRPSGNMEEGKVYYSGKHKRYGYKTEVSVLPNGMALGVADHCPGSKADVDMFYENIEFHQKALEKREQETNIVDTGELCDEYQHMWAALADKGYQGGEQHVRLLHPKRKPPNGILTAEENARNRKLSADRIIVENYFGRFCSLWTVFAVKWKWSEKNYNALYQFAAALTNLHIKWYPLRAEDLEHYTRKKNRLHHIGNSITAKRNARQKRYREKKRRRLDARFNAADSNDETLEP